MRRIKSATIFQMAYEFREAFSYVVVVAQTCKSGLRVRRRCGCIYKKRQQVAMQVSNETKKPPVTLHPVKQ